MLEEYPLVTCTIYTYRNLKYIYEALDSVFIQDYPNIELNIQDDGTEEFPYDDICDYIEQNKRKNILCYDVHTNTENLGTVKSCNIAIKNVHGKYMMDLSGDDVFFDNSVVSRVVSYFRKTNANVVVCRRLDCMESDLSPIGAMPEDCFRDDIMSLDTSQKQFMALALGRSHLVFCGACVYFDADFMKSRGGYDEHYKLAEDFTFFMEYLHDGGVASFAWDIISIRYRRGGISTGHSINTVLAEDVLTSYNQYILPDIEKFDFISRIRLRYLMNVLQLQNVNPDYNATLFHLKHFVPAGIGAFYKLKDKVRKTVYSIRM